VQLHELARVAALPSVIAEDEGLSVYASCNSCGVQRREERRESEGIR
jgi:hypothetical protein